MTSQRALALNRRTINNQSFALVVAPPARLVSSPHLRAYLRSGSASRVRVDRSLRPTQPIAQISLAVAAVALDQRGFARDVSGQWSAGCGVCRRRWPAATMEVRPSREWACCVCLWSRRRVVWKSEHSMTSFRGATQSIVSRFSLCFSDFKILERFSDIIFSCYNYVWCGWIFLALRLLKGILPLNFVRIFYYSSAPSIRMFVCTKDWPAFPN